MRLVRIGRAIWDVLAIADQFGRSRWWEELAARTDSAAEQMRAALEIDVPRNRPQGRPLGDGIFEFKEPGLRVLWFYGEGRRVVCTHSCPKLPKKKFQQEIATAKRIRDDYLIAKKNGTLKVPE